MLISDAETLRSHPRTCRVCQAESVYHQRLGFWIRCTNSFWMRRVLRGQSIASIQTTGQSSPNRRKVEFDSRNQTKE
eukprot:3185213-Pyramimonas_sp.AAC.1